MHTSLHIMPSESEKHFVLQFVVVFCSHFCKFGDLERLGPFIYFFNPFFFLHSESMSSEYLLFL